MKRLALVASAIGLVLAGCGECPPITGDYFSNEYSGVTQLDGGAPTVVRFRATAPNEVVTVTWERDGHTYVARYRQAQ